MRNTRTRVNPTLTGGASLILLVFLVITLISFSSLSIVSARADKRLSDKYQTGTQDYYNARNLEQQCLALLQDAIAGRIRVSSRSGGLTPVDARTGKTLSRQEYFRLLDSVLGDSALFCEVSGISGSSAALRSVSYESAGHELRMQIRVSDTQDLAVCLVMTDPEEGDGTFWRIRQEETVSTVSFEYDDSLPVIGGDAP